MRRIVWFNREFNVGIIFTLLGIAGFSSSIISANAFAELGFATGVNGQAFMMFVYGILFVFGLICMYRASRMKQEVLEYA